MMNVFILCTGRCGSTTISEACRFMTNFSSGHETRTGLLGDDRLAYPENHVEADNRLSWLLGRLDKAYGDAAFYVHLQRDVEATAASFVKRYRSGIMKAYRHGGILHTLPRRADRYAVALDYCLTVNSNIEVFMRDKTKTMQIQLETAKDDFPTFWERIGAEGDLEEALLEFDTRHNAS